MAQRGGQLGNSNATKSKPWIAALEKHAKQNPNKLAMMAEKVFDAALEGQPWAVQEIGNRLDGKPVQPSEVKVTTDSPSLTDAYLAHVAAGGKPDEYEKTQH